MLDNATKERRLVSAFHTVEAAQALAADFPFQPENPCEQWAKLIWYSDKCGGKLIIFKAGSPYLPKKGKRKGNDTLTEEEHEKIRLANSLSRTRKRIFEIAACNSWEWFFTGTLDGEKVDRNDLNGTFRKLSQFIRDYRKKQDGEKIRYLIVPEEHKKGGWHFHGLIGGLNEREMHKFSTSEKIPARIKATIAGGTDVYTWKAYAEKFGFSTMTKVRDELAVSCYVTKYITKDMVYGRDKQGSGQHLYYASQGLKKPVTLAESYPTTSYPPQTDYENDWVAVHKVATREEAEAIIRRYNLQRGD